MEDVAAFRLDAVGGVHVHPRASGTSWSGADDEEDLVGEQVATSGEPFDGVLERGGHRAVVFGAGNDDGIGSANGVAEGFGFSGYALCLDIGVKHGDGVQIENSRLHSPIRGLVDHVLQELEIPRLFPEASAYAEDFHGVPWVVFVLVRMDVRSVYSAT